MLTMLLCGSEIMPDSALLMNDPLPCFGGS